eukprot:scaffold115645_cov63-Phaeocystis_antarctica.AAC.2
MASSIAPLSVKGQWTVRLRERLRHSGRNCCRAHAERRSRKAPLLSMALWSVITSWGREPAPSPLSPGPSQLLRRRDASTMNRSASNHATHSRCAHHPALSAAAVLAPPSGQGEAPRRAPQSRCAAASRAAARSTRGCVGAARTLDTHAGRSS